MCCDFQPISLLQNCQVASPYYIEYEDDKVTFFRIRRTGGGKEFGRPIRYVRYVRTLTIEAANRENRLEQLLKSKSKELSPQEKEKIKEEIRSIHDDPANWQITSFIATSKSGEGELPEVEVVIWYETRYKGRRYTLMGPPPELLGVRKELNRDEQEDGILNHGVLEEDEDDYKERYG
jgi:hypothetical protein